MPNAVWPLTLPQYVSAQGYSEAPQDLVLRSPMDGGGGKTRNRFTARFDQFAVSMVMEGDQVTLFESFYKETLGDGALPFDWVHPRRRTAATFKILGAVKIDGLDSDQFRLSFRLEKQP